MKLRPILRLPRTAQKALKFYVDALGAQIVSVRRFKECGVEKQAKQHQNLIAQSQVRIGKSILIIRDTMQKVEPVCRQSNLEISVAIDSQDRILRAYREFEKQGKILMPLKKQFWGALYFRVCDQFNVNWSLNYELKSGQETLISNDSPKVPLKRKECPQIQAESGDSNEQNKSEVVSPPKRSQVEKQND